MSMNCMDNAITQFHTALQAGPDRHLWTFINLNLGIVYARTNKLNEFMSIAEHIQPQTIPDE